MADPNAPAAAVTFSLVPGDGTGIIDYSDRRGLAIYSQATKSLYQDPADHFNVDSAGLHTFLALLGHRGTTCGWDLDVPQDLTQPLQNLMNLLDNHGRFTVDHLHAFSSSYINNQSRAAQQNMQMVTCILASLSLPGFRKVQTWRAAWHIAERPAALLLIKVIIRESFIDTQATTRILREHLSSLPAKLTELKGDIDQLNAFVKLTEDQLAARGETSTDLLANLFKGYLTSQDSTFRRYIEKKQEDYDDGTVFTVDGLMTLASNKFKTLVQNGTWLSPTDEQSKILALETKLSQMTKKPSSSGKDSGSGKGKSGGKSGKGNSGGKGKTPQGKSGGKKPIAAWMTKWPGRAFVDANQTKVVEGRTYWWCKKHKRFCMHQTSECRLTTSPGGASDRPASSSGSGTGDSPATTPSIRVSTATLMNE